jgi:ubiquitin-activating enzyme E1
MKFSELVKHVSKKPIPPGVNRLIVEIMASDEEDEDVEVRNFVADSHHFSF